MPVIFSVAPVEPKEYRPEEYYIDFEKDKKRTKIENLRDCLRLSSVYKDDAGGKILAVSSDPKTKYYPATSNGFVNTVVEAYCRHHSLVLRPDDVWLAILTQFSFYVNKYPEELREKLVKHQGKITIESKGGGDRYSANWADHIKQLTTNCQSYLKDENLREWILPNFSTTTEKDITVASVIMMGALQNFFGWKCSLECGIPFITLMGNKEDWIGVRNKINRLLEYDLPDDMHMFDWYEMLVPILNQFVKVFESSLDDDFWSKICHYHGGSGDHFISGWITAFCFFTNKGERNPPHINSLSGRGSWLYVNRDKIPSGFVSVPVTIDDNGVEFESRFFAGHLAFATHSSSALQPMAEWAIAEVSEKSNREKSNREINIVRGKKNSKKVTLP